MRTHDELLAQAAEVDAAATITTADRLSKEYGIKGTPLLSYIHSLSFPHSFPYDFMHLIWENTIKNLILHWTGEFKALDQGKGTYKLSTAIWEGIGALTASSGSTIPSAYGSRVPNIKKDHSLCTADMWSFWTLYIGPVLLWRRFDDVKYYKHFILLVKLVTDPPVTLARKVDPGLQDLQTRARRILAARNAEKAEENTWIGRMVTAESIGELNGLIKSRAA